MLTITWHQLAGRVSSTNPFDVPGCWTYPAYKMPVNNTVEYLHPASSGSSFVANPILFVGVAILPFFVIYAIVGICFSYWEGKKAEK